MSEHDRQIETLETRIIELESQLAISEGARDALRELFHKAEADAREGRSLFTDLYQRHFVDGDDYDRQLADMMDWAGIEAEE